MQIWHRLQRLGISVPGERETGRFDGDEYGSLVGLTTALFDSEALAETAFDASFDLIAHGRTEIVDMAVPVVLRMGNTSSRPLSGDLQVPQYNRLTRGDFWCFITG